MREALGWTAFWIALSFVFNGFIFLLYEHHWWGVGETIGKQLSGHQAALQYLTGYLIEKTLSLDNIFVIAMIFTFFGVPNAYQHRLLFWGVLGAIVMRAVMIFAGIAALEHFAWMIYVFGGFLIYTALKMLVTHHEKVDPERNLLVRAAKKLLPITREIEGPHFFVKREGRWWGTPLCIALVAVESADLLFAVDSIPAVIAVTRDPFLVFTSNVFAILGLRSLYFALAALLERFRYLRYSLVFLLAFVGTKMILTHHYPIPTTVSLIVIATIIFAGILVSVAAARPKRQIPPLESQEEMLQWLKATGRRIRKIFVAIAGVTLLLVGAALLFLPGPGTVVIAVGLGLLATQFVWAKRLLKRIEKEARDAVNAARGRSSQSDESDE